MSHISGSSSGDYPSGDEVVLEDKNGDAEIRELEKSETCDDSWKFTVGACFSPCGSRGWKMAQWDFNMIHQTTEDIYMCPVPSCVIDISIL